MLADKPAQMWYKVRVSQILHDNKRAICILWPSMRDNMIQRYAETKLNSESMGSADSPRKSTQVQHNLQLSHILVKDGKGILILNNSSTSTGPACWLGFAYSNDFLWMLFG